MKLPDCMLNLKLLYPTVSLGGIKDRIQVNFGHGKTQFRFDLATKTQVSIFNHFSIALTILSNFKSSLI